MNKVCDIQSSVQREQGVQYRQSVQYEQGVQCDWGANQYNKAQRRNRMYKPNKIIVQQFCGGFFKDATMINKSQSPNCLAHKVTTIIKIA